MLEDILCIGVGGVHHMLERLAFCNGPRCSVGAFDALAARKSSIVLRPEAAFSRIRGFDDDVVTAVGRENKLALAGIDPCVLTEIANILIARRVCNEVVDRVVVGEADCAWQPLGERPLLQCGSFLLALLLSLLPLLQLGQSLRVGPLHYLGRIKTKQRWRRDDTRAQGSDHVDDVTVLLAFV